MDPVAMVVLWGLKDRHTISVSWPAMMKHQKHNLCLAKRAFLRKGLDKPWGEFGR